MFDPVIVRDTLIGFFMIGVLLRASHAAERAFPSKTDIDDAWRRRFIEEEHDSSWHRMV